MADAIYGGATIEATQNDTVRQLQSTMKGYQRQLSHDGVYAVVTLMANDDSQRENPGQEDGEEGTLEKTEQPRKCYIFCPERDRVRLFEELDHKTAAPLIPAFRDYVLASLQNRGDLRQLEVISQKERIDAWTLDLAPDDKNVIEVLEEGLKAGTIQIPGAVPGAPDGFDEVNNVTGYKIIACVNTPAGKDAEGSTNYAYVKSQALEVVDENGQGFRPYTYPDITIDEKTLEPGATTLHISMTGDQRIFDAAVAKKIDINYTIGMYPAGDEFQIEDGSTITLVQLGKTTGSITHQEVTLTQPLKAGWRVRAVAYWDGCPELFIARSNDYQLGQADDSVLVSGTAEENIPTAAIQGTPKAGDTSVTVQLGGKIPESTYIVLKKYDAGTADADCVLSGGTFLANRSASVAGEQTLTFSDALTAGEKLAAFLTNNGQLAKSQPVTVAAAQTTPLFTITPKGALTADSTQITFTVISSDPSITSVGTFLCPVKNGSVDSDHWIARQLGQKLGDITLDIPEGKLKDGDVVRLILNYEKNDDFP